MARKSSGTILQEELYPSSPERSRPDRTREESPREELEDARLVDLDVAEESPFLRGQKRVSARRSSLPKKTADRLLWATAAVLVLGVVVLIAAELYDYGEHSWRFRVESSDNIEVTGMQNVTKAQIMEVMGADIGRNIFFVPLAQQKAQLEQIPWVDSASVMRFVPNRLKVEIHERTPVAFARVGPRISLIDAGGTLMDMSQKHKYSFPVIQGMNPGEPLSTRAPRMKAYNELVQDLDSSGAHYSQDLSEVDISDLENLKVRVNDPAGDVLVELGSSDYLKRYKIYVSHVQEWRQQFKKLESVNLRYDNQVIVNPDMEGRVKQSAPLPASAKAAGLRPATLVTKIGAKASNVPPVVAASAVSPVSTPHSAPTINNKSLPKPAFELTAKTLDPKSAAKKPVARPKVKKAIAKSKGAPVKKLATKKPAAGNSAPKAGTASKHVAQKPAAKKPAGYVQSAAVSGATPKPSAAIAK